MIVVEFRYGTASMPSSLGMLGRAPALMKISSALIWRVLPSVAGCGYHPNGWMCG
jgi:hypothetical protein